MSNCCPPNNCSGPYIHSVAGKTGCDILLYPVDVHLGNVDNTSDIDKPVSAYTQIAINQAITNFANTLVDHDNYVDSVAFDTNTRILTLGRTGTLPDLTVTIPETVAPPPVTQGWQDTLIVNPDLSQDNTSQLNGFFFDMVSTDLSTGDNGEFYIDPTTSALYSYNTTNGTKGAVDVTVDNVSIAAGNEINPSLLQVSGQGVSFTDVATFKWNGAVTGAGYVLTDLTGDGNLTLQPPTGGGTTLTLTTTGTSGVATYNSGTGVLNIPNYTSGGGGGLQTWQETLDVTNGSILTHDNDIEVSGTQLAFNLSNTGTNFFKVDGIDSAFPSVAWNLDDGAGKGINFQTFHDGLDIEQIYDAVQNGFNMTNGGVEMRSRTGSNPYASFVVIPGEADIIAPLLNINLPGTTGAGYVLTDLAGDGYATWQPAPSGGGSVDAANGLHIHSGDSKVYLGGTLLEDTTITTNAFALAAVGNNSSSIFGAVQSGGGAAITATTFGAGNAFIATNFNANPVVNIITTPSGNTNNVIPTIFVQRQTSGTAANGIGSAWDTYIRTSDGFNSNIAGRVITKWTNATAGAQTSQFEIWGVNSSALARKLAIKGDGGLIGDTYGSGTHTGTATYALQVDSSGNVIEGALGGGGGSITADNGLNTVLSSTNVQLGGDLLFTTFINAGIYQLNVNGTQNPLKGLSTGAGFFGVIGENTGGGVGVYAKSSTGSGLIVEGGSTAAQISSTGGMGAYIYATGGVGANINSYTDYGAIISRRLNSAGGNTVLPALELMSDYSSGATSDGFGTGVDFYGSTTTWSTRRWMGSIQYVWTTAADATRTSSVDFWGVNAGTSGLIISLPPVITNYASNAAAIAGGLAVGKVYRQGDLLAIVH